jgi:hypothetical protein
LKAAPRFATIAIRQLRQAERGNSMKRFGVTFATAAALALGCVAGTATPAQAAAPVGGCPDSFQLISLQDLASLLGLTLEQVEAIPGIDTNRDLMTCFTQLPNGRFAGMDNHVPAA